MKKYYEYLFSIVVGILYGLFYIQRGQECDLYIALLEGNFCDFIAFNFGYFTSFMESMVPFFVYQMLYGVAIYQHFTTANVYYFTRQNNRKRWFLKEAWKLFKNTGSHMLLFLLGRCFIVQIGNTYSCSTKTVFIFLVVCFLQTCYLYFFTLLINICGIRWNSMVGIMVAIVLQVCALVSLYPLKTYSVNMWRGWYFRLNPVANMIVSWHKSKRFFVDENVFNVYFPIWFSVLYYALAIVIVLFVGFRWIKKDLLHEQQDK